MNVFSIQLRKPFISSKIYQRGVTLIEILVTIVILAVGMLGLAAMQTMSLKNINNSQYRTLATIYAYDMAERMRSNQAGVQNGNYNDIEGEETNPSCSPCSSVQIAQLDAFQWQQAIQQAAADGGLPAGALGTVEDVDSIANAFDISVSWPEQTQDETGSVMDTQEYVFRIQL
ncbi:type IV pilus modification protein PilV [Marinibactrum halimedae]|uniref:Type IV pilus modification protein PilV n=1 Tax=Marinibactrum halimedae TaxID=1444977 RepID=A0AA37WNB0_9GAMM|nr:type IV pilus modification protein PilV [Marinibactrum halimedae]MCD9460246.1 type IV pilus modification protein PilV [Marinibactrum halimedae]GLS27919.1 hypothetical protein GCM10007877_36380 [Marinibactrum halimedae]